MTEQERREGFLRALQEAEQRFGMAIAVNLQHEMLGSVLQVRPAVTVVPIADWTPPAQVKSPDTPLQVQPSKD